jgi:hypothetical protein
METQPGTPHQGHEWNLTLEPRRLFLELWNSPCSSADLRRSPGAKKAHHEAIDDDFEAIEAQIGVMEVH